MSDSLIIDRTESEIKIKVHTVKLDEMSSDEIIAWIMEFLHKITYSNLQLGIVGSK